MKYRAEAPPQWLSELEILGRVAIAEEKLLGLSDRIAVMHDGAIAGVLPRAEATQEGIMEPALQFTS